MALNIKIDIEKRYPTEDAGNDFRYFTFDCPQKNKSVLPLVIKISDEEHPLMPDVFNLAFGPIGADGQLDDQIQLRHEDYSKTFSTIVFAALTFLLVNRDKYLGIDGSNTARAYMYYKCIQNNFEYLENYFSFYGIYYYTRLLRDDINYTYPDDYLVIPERIKKNIFVRPDKLYNYFIFKYK